MPNVWDKYQKIKEIKNKSNIKTYLARIEPIIKEITPKDEDEYNTIIDYFSELKDKFKVYDIIQEKQIIYLVVENKDEINKEIDNLLISGKFNEKKESILEGHGNPITKEEIFGLFKMEGAMCKIKFERIQNNKLIKGKGTGFFCEIKVDDFPLKHCLLTNNHVLNEDNLKKTKQYISNILKIENILNEK